MNTRSLEVALIITLANVYAKSRLIIIDAVYTVQRISGVKIYPGLQVDFDIFNIKIY